MNEQQLEKERTSNRMAGILGFVGIAVFLGAAFVGVPEGLGDDDSSVALAAFDEDSGSVLLLTILQVIAFLLFIAPLMAIFRSTAARTPSMRFGLIGLTVAAPLFLAGWVLFQYIGLDNAANSFFDPANDVDTSSSDAADDAITGETAHELSLGLQFAGSIGVAAVIVYSSLHAMRSGLFTRFWGTLLMALGAGALLLGPPAILLYVVVVSAILLGWWPGERPPAWAAGKAVPWPEPGRGGAQPDSEPEPEEPARPEDFEGTAEPIDPARPGRRDNKRKRKRKQR